MIHINFKKLSRYPLIFIIIFGWVFGSWANFEFIPSTPLVRVEHAKAVVPSGVIVAWPSTNASIPSGWSRVTTLDDYFLEATIATPSVTPGGSVDHSHTSPTHIHTMGHSHTGTTGNSSGSVTNQSGTGGVADAHTHTITTNVNTGNNDPQSANFVNASNAPPYIDVIWIKSNGTTEIPDSAWTYFNSDTMPTNWSRQSGNRFLKGAIVSGDGGGTGGTSDSHTHTDSGHIHTEASHTHTGTSDAATAQTDSKSGTGASNIAHTHTISGGSTTATETQDSGVINNADAQPPFYKLNIIQNDTGGGDTPDNVIAMWDGAVGSIPSNWVLCDGVDTCPNLDNYFIKGANADAELGNTGGNLTHTHTAGTAHGHTINSHTHNFTVNADASGSQSRSFKTGSDKASYAHGHSLDITQTGGSTGTATITADANSDNRPPYKEIVYIQYQAPAVAISLNTNGVINFGTVVLNTSQDTTAAGVDDVETISVDIGPADLDIKSAVFTEGGNTWSLNTTNGANQIKWEFSPDGTAWTTFAAADTLYALATGVSQGSTQNTYLRITLPTVTDSYGQYGGTITIIASEP